jgi:hypothetical protein
MAKLPSDRKLLQEIFDRHYEAYVAHSRTEPTHGSKIMVPIDIPAIAKTFNVDTDLIFGRLYYHLQQKYGYTQPNGALVAFFSPVAGQDKNCVNMPLLAAVLAGMQEEQGRYLWAIILSIASLIVSIIALTVSVYVK